MEKRIQLQKKANIIAANGQSIGHIDRVVLNPVTRVITDIVVEKGILFDKKEKVVPIALVAETTEDQIVLREEAGDLEAFPAFEEEQIISERPNMPDMDMPGMDETQPPVRAPRSVNYGFPEVGPALVPPVGDQFVTRVKQNIPEGTVAMKEGAKVITSEGDYVGNVENVLAETSLDQVTHLLVSRGMFAKETKLVPIHWVMTMGEDEVYLRVKKDAIEDLENMPVAV